MSDALPWSEHAEEGVLGACLVDPAVLEQIAPTLTTEDFARPHHQLIWDAILDIRQAGGLVDPVAVAEVLDRAGQLERVGGAEQIRYLADAIPSAKSGPWHATVVRQKARLRGLLRLAADLQGAAGARDAEPDALVAHVTDRLARLATASAAAPRLTLHARTTLAALPPLDWLVPGLLPAKALALLVGEPAAGKSFVALDLALSLANGMTWLGQGATRAGPARPVLYVAGEGFAGLRQRCEAWEQCYGVEPGADVRFVTDPINLMDPTSVADITRACQAAQFAPALVVVDTLHRATPGMDENAAQDVGVAVQQVDRLRHQLNAAVLLVHHTRKGGDVERGSGALKGAVDTMWLLRDDDGQPVLECHKQKDAEAHGPVALLLEPHGTSLVARRDVGLRINRAADPARLSRGQAAILEAMHDLFDDAAGVGTAALQRVSKLDDRAFILARNALKRARLIVSDGATPQGHPVWRLTAEGRHAVAVRRGLAPKPVANPDGWWQEAA